MMRFLLALLLLAPVASRAQPYPGSDPANPLLVENITIFGNELVQGALNVSGATSLGNGGSLTGVFGGQSTINGLVAGLRPVATGGLSAVTGASVGDMLYVTDCANGSQSFPGTGCPAYYNANGVWVMMPTPSNLSMTIGGQSIVLGGSTTNQGNGSKIQTASGAQPISGDCAQFNAGGALVDALVSCGGGGGGGSGTITVGTQFSMPFYSGAGTSSTIGAMGIVNNAVVATNGSGQPAETTTLPNGLTIPSASLSNPTLTGTISIGTATYTGKQTFLAGTVSAASLNIPPGVAPTSPVNGDEWETSVGLFSRINGTTQGPYLYSAATSSPLAGGGVGPTLTLTCPSCATTTNGGALAATAPLTISSAGLIALGSQTSPLVWIADAAFVVHNDTYPLIEQWPWTGGGTLNKVVYHTGGTTSPAFNVTFAVCTGGVSGTCTNVSGCTNIAVSSTADNTATCSAGAIATNQTLAMTVTGVTGSPSSAVVQLNISKPAS